MGGVAGHLSHVHEDLDFTFGEIKSLLSDVASAKIKAVEKLDGQNIFFKFFVDPESGELRTARNAGDVKKGGMTADEFIAMFKGHGAEAPFLNGFEAINRALSRVSPESLKKIFTGEDGNQRFVDVLLECFQGQGVALACFLLYIDKCRGDRKQDRLQDRAQK